MPYKKLNISTPKPVPSWANHALGGQETQRAKNVAGLPFVFKVKTLLLHIENVQTRLLAQNPLKM